MSDAPPPDSPWAAPSERRPAPSASWGGTQGHGRPPAPGGTVPGGPAGNRSAGSREVDRTDPVSVAALVTGVLPTGPVAAALGVLGVRRTGRGRRPGRALAVTGLVLGLAWTGVGVAAGVSLLQGPGVDGDVPDPRGMASAHLRVGNCVRNLPAHGEVGRVSLVPCAEPHTAQVVHVGALERTPERPEDAQDEGRELCEEAAAATDTRGETVDVVTLVPTSGTAPVVCLLEWPTPVSTDLVN
ncbi:hypothetical protein ATJ97_2695 [Georgenia soli]|uniref:DUF4190 domain-containing protein n=1 Tax=Georgenia soli TaxID=638953 RepID=A0A2A9EMI0_9MICO|nr:hypothetical protein [Georgenia soli]PFG40174.1 hypothetical protein ATJ97_2695 [Georgenia soli]